MQGWLSGRRLRVVAIAALVMAGACSGGGARPAAPAPAAPTTTTTSAASGSPSVPPSPSASGPCPAVPERLEPLPDRPRYQLKVDVRPAENVVVGDVAVRFTPDIDTDRLVFRLWPNGPATAQAGANLAVGAVRMDGRLVAAVMADATTLVVRPEGKLARGRPVEVVLPWRLTLPGPVGERVSRHGDAIRLGSFFPILAWEPGSGWATEPPTGEFAESSTAPAADFAAIITVPPDLEVLATGTSNGGGRWTAEGVPDFAVSVGRFATATATAKGPHPVRVTVGVHRGLGEAPSVYLRPIVRAIEDFSRRFGPYPWPAYTMAVTPELPGGIEYPMHVFQGPDTLDATTPHEVAHMWFYGLVSNNQGRDPWLDEGLASWGEARFEGTLAQFLARPVPEAGRGRLGEPMSFWEGRRSAYFRSVYVQGVQALAALGPPELVDCALRLYVARTAYRIARPRDLVEAARAVFPAAAETLARFGVRP